MDIREQPLPTDVCAVGSFVPEPGSAYVFGWSVEERSKHVNEWSTNARDVRFVRISISTLSSFDFDLDGSTSTVQLRSSKQLARFWQSFHTNIAYLDITGLPHHVWAPLLREALRLGLRLMAVYVEPVEYKHSPTPMEGEIFDLSESIMGIAPLPGFITLAEGNEEKVCFIPLLGFEGVRFSYVLEQVQPPGGKIYPIVGVPGFRPEFPFFTYHGNKAPFLDSRAWKNVRFAKGNCPFAALYTLGEIANEHPDDTLKVAPIGTKPHALGAILFALSAPRKVELIYDHPIRKPERTSGHARLLVYHVSLFPLAPVPPL